MQPSPAYTERFEELMRPTTREQFRIDKRRYFDAAFMALEWQRVWRRVWLLAAATTDLKRSGDYVVFEIGAESIIVLRDEDGTVRAFHNTCQHRGTRLVACAAGRAAHFRCRYHGWEWGIDGDLQRVPNEAGFRFPIEASRRRLAPVACEVWGGFVWLCLDEPTQTLREYLGPVAAMIEQYQPETFVISKDFVAHWQANWKVALDAFSETYHVNATHPQLLNYVDPAVAEFEFFGVHGLMKVPLGVLGPDSPAEARNNRLLSTLITKYGGDAERYLDSEPEVARKYLQGLLRERSREVGVELSELTDEQLTDTRQFFIFPNIHFDFHGCNNFTIFRYRPDARDPERCSFDFLDFSRPGLYGYDANHRAPHESLSGDELPLTIRQDARVIELLQEGMRSSAFGSAVLHELECRIAHIHHAIDAFVGSEGYPSLPPEPARTA